MRLPIIFVCVASLYTPLAFAENAGNYVDNCNQSVRNGDPAKALDAAKSALKLDAGNLPATLCKARAESSLAEYASALDTLKLSQKLAKTPFDQMTVLSMTGNIQKNANQLEAAMESYRLSLAIARTDKNKRFERINLNQIGDLLILLNQPQTALENYRAGSQLAANDNERADNYERLAATYSKLGQHDLAIEHQLKAIVMEERSGDLDHYVNAELELGRIYTQASLFEKAEKSIGKVIKLSREQGGAYWEAKSYFYLAKARLANQQKNDAKKLLDDARGICQNIGEDELNAEVVSLLKTIQ